MENLWSRKCVRKMIFRTVKVRVEGGELTFHCAKCKGSSILHQKWILPISSEIRRWIFFYSTIFWKKTVFSEKNSEKLFRGHIWRFFRERRRLAPKINTSFSSQIMYWIFYYLAVFSKRAVFTEKTQKNRFWRPSPF